MSEMTSLAQVFLVARSEYRSQSQAHQFQNLISFIYLSTISHVSTKYGIYKQNEWNQLKSITNQNSQSERNKLLKTENKSSINKTNGKKHWRKRPMVWRTSVLKEMCSSKANVGSNDKHIDLNVGQE